MIDIKEKKKREKEGYQSTRPPRAKGSGQIWALIAVVVMWWAREWEKSAKGGGQNVYVQCVCTQRQLILHMQKKREKKGWKGGIEARVKSKREER